MVLRCQHASNTKQFAETELALAPFTKRFNTLFPTQPLPIIADNLLSEAQGLHDDSTMLDARPLFDSRPSFSRSNDTFPAPVEPPKPEASLRGPRRGWQLLLSWLQQSAHLRF